MLISVTLFVLIFIGVNQGQCKVGIYFKSITVQNDGSLNVFFLFF